MRTSERRVNRFGSLLFAGCAGMLACSEAHRPRPLASDHEDADGADDLEPLLDGGGDASEAGPTDASDDAHSVHDASESACDLEGEGKPTRTIPQPLGASFLLTADTVWQLATTTYVAAGETLTIEPCTRIEGLPARGASEAGLLVVSRGGRIEAAGLPDAPILFTGSLELGERSPGDWGGIILLGRAPTSKGQEAFVEGLPFSPESRYGGSIAADDSGVMAYVRIELTGSPPNFAVEHNGLTMAGVGSGSDIHHVMVNATLDDCFEWFGGRVNAHHLICNGVGDDMFDTDQGYQGNLSYLFGRLDPDVYSSDDPNGFEMDSDSDGATPTTTVTVKNATLCGGNEALSGTSFGMVLRENLEGSIDNVAVTGFDYGVDTRDDFGTPADPKVTLTNAQFFGMRTDDVRGEETGDADNDDGFDEDAYFAMGDGNEVPDTAPYTPEDCLAADGPTDAVTGSGIGAFEDLDGWDWDGLWIDWSTN